MSAPSDDARTGGRERTSGIVERSRRSRLSAADRRFKWTLSMPAVGFTFLMILLPLAYTVFISLTNAKGSLSRPFSFVGLENYAALLTDTGRFLPAVGRTVLFTGVAVLLELALGLAVALLLAKSFRGERWVRVSVLLPIVVTPVAVAMMWMMFFQPTLGAANEIMRFLGLPEQTWVSDPSMALWLLILVDVWQWTPMVMLILLAGLVSLPSDPIEAAHIDGASPAQRLLYVTLPMLRPAIVAAVLLRTIDALKTFDILYTMKGPGGGSLHEVETLNLYGYALSFQYADYGLASAMLVLFILLVLGLTVVLLRTRKVD